MIEISFALGSCLVLLGWIAYRSLVCLRQKRLDGKREAKLLFYLINLLVLYRCTFHPFAKVDGQVQPLVFDAAKAWPFRFSLLPFSELDCFQTTRDLLRNLIGNFTMFIPTGFMTPLLYPNRNTFGKVLCSGFLLSLTIELLQLPFFDRVSDIDDLILNTAGCAVGYGILALLRALRRKGTHHA